MTERTIHEHLLSRREAIVRVSALLGGTGFVGQSALLAGCVPTASLTSTGSGAVFSAADIAWLDEVADTILPATQTPGAKAAGVGPFIALMVSDTYTADEQAQFRGGMHMLENECIAAFDVGFVTATPAQRLTLLERIDAEQFRYMQTRRRGQPAHYFRLIKELTLLGYFTSEIGYTQALRYVETPGRFDPCVPYAPGDRAWAPHA
jgi:hypothetical protein